MTVRRAVFRRNPILASDHLPLLALPYPQNGVGRSADRVLAGHWLQIQPVSCLGIRV